MIWAWLLPMLFLVVRVNAGCTLHDFKWKPNTAPVVTQPRSNDPSKVLVNWSPAIHKNGRCVDEWTMIVYKDGSSKTNATKIVNKDKAARSMVVNVQPGVNYRFSVEYLEKETFDDRGETKEAVFRTTGVPAITRNGPHQRKKIKKRMKKESPSKGTGLRLKKGKKISTIRKTSKRLNIRSHRGKTSTKSGVQT